VGRYGIIIYKERQSEREKNKNITGKEVLIRKNEK
jgi:hypothetical protein